MASSVKIKKSYHFGLHRVVHPQGVFPQAAHSLNPSLPPQAHEILIAVDRLNLDSASFRQLWEESKRHKSVMIQKILRIIHSRGKMHNPVTHSGGTLLGTVIWKGKNSSSPLKIGDRVVTLVSLTLTPLSIEKIISVDVANEQIIVKGHAILFDTGFAETLPKDFPEPVALAIYDVCGAPALTQQICRKGQTVVILGGGKAGLLSAAAARNKMGPRRKNGKNGQIFILEKNPKALREAKKMSFVDKVFSADLKNPAKTYADFSKITDGSLADLVINCVNISGTEMASILLTHKKGTVIFFNMATHFSSAVLGAEGITHPARLIMGNGYSPGHTKIALDLMRHFPDLKNWFHKKFNVLE